MDYLFVGSIVAAVLFIFCFAPACEWYYRRRAKHRHPAGSLRSTGRTTSARTDRREQSRDDVRANAERVRERTQQSRGG